MKKLSLILLLFSAIVCFSQKQKDVSKVIVGKWVIDKMVVTIDNEKRIKETDTSIYNFTAQGTYTLYAHDLWGRSKTVGKWKPEGKSKVKLYDIIPISEVKGVLQSYGPGYEVELKNIDGKEILFISHYDKGMEWLYELYYKRADDNIPLPEFELRKTSITSDSLNTKKDPK